MAMLADLTSGLSFGWRTAILFVTVVQTLIVAAALSRQLRNHVANRTMAALLVVLAGVVSPWMIGFAGFYDKWRWLSFAPLAVTLAVAPLLWLYVRALVDGHWPSHGWRHLSPAMAQWLFLSASFCLPMPIKTAWADQVGLVYDVITSGGVLIGLAAYGVAALRLLARYRRLLAAARADAHRYAARWLVAVIAAMMLLLPGWASFVLWDWLVSPLGYTGLMGLYVLIAIVALFLAIESWRHAGLAFPTLAELTPAEEPPSGGHDWAVLGRDWAARIDSGGWARDPEIDLKAVARRLGTNVAYLSRALNDGTGISFPAFINGLRSRHVAAMLDDGRDDDLLDLALEAGFSSKASFNRAFRDTTGVTPSAYRHRAKAKRHDGADHQNPPA